MPSGVYWIYQPDRDRAVYVGSSQNIVQRWRSHRSLLNRGKHANRHLQATWNKYGPSAFQFLELEVCAVERLAEREKFWMAAIGPTCNIAIATDAPGRGLPMSAENRRKMSERLRGQPKSEEHRRRIGEAQIGKFVKSPPEEQRQAVSTKLRGRKPWNTGITMSDEQKRGMSERMMGNQYLLGHVHSEDTRRKMSEAHTGSKRKPLSEETRRKISEANKGRIPWNKRDAK